MRRDHVEPGADAEDGGASLFALTFALLLIGVSALGAMEVADLTARRADVRKIEALGLAAMDRSGGVGALACAIATRDFAIPCEFGGGEIILRKPHLPAIPIGWRSRGGAF